MTPPFSLTSPSAAIAAAPYLLGYTPESCVVAIHVIDGLVGMTMRLPLPWCGDANDEPVDMNAWADFVASRADHVRVDSVVLLCFADDDREACERALTGVQRAYDERGIHVRDSLVVTVADIGTRWRSVQCQNTECCPPDGRLLAEDEADRVRAHFVLQGCAPLACRTDLIAEVESVHDARADEILHLTIAMEARLDDQLADDPYGVALESWRDEVIEDVGDLLGLAGPIARGWDDDEIALMCSGLLDAKVRDTLVWEIARPQMESAWRPLSALLGEAVRLAPAGYVAPLATLLGQLHWSLGDGTRASMALDRALADDEDYVMARLMRHAIGNGIPPISWLETLRSVPRSEFRHGPRRVPRAS